jgi:hypothetical protein
MGGDLLQGRKSRHSWSGSLAMFSLSRINFNFTHGVGWTILMGKGGGGIFDFGFVPSTSGLGFSFPGVTLSPRKSFGVIIFSVSGVVKLEAELS